MIIDFLDMLLMLLHTTVAKNWKNMKQFLMVRKTGVTGFVVK